MKNLRIIARLDIKGPNLIKGVHLEGLRKLGDPNEYALRYYREGADELLYMDIVASLYGRNSLTDIIRRTAENIFIPLTVGGGVRSIADVETLLKAGADKVAINTQATRTPELIGDVARRFGSQCMVVSIEAKRQGEGRWEAFVDNGREHTGYDVVEWARHAADLGAGEVLLTSVDREGTRNGLDVELARAVAGAVAVPVILSGGFGKPQDLVTAVTEGMADAIGIADALHYRRYSLAELRATARANDIAVREPLRAD
ncbi:MAG TPA: imidazole glycerol phosphate synthase cyclase subunit [Kaistiaceae bacterium]|nr:imidazole glycerol phosphate synthase cyclase subunit [Kaistiaceae bacterium]